MTITYDVKFIVEYLSSREWIALQEAPTLKEATRLIWYYKDYDCYYDNKPMRIVKIYTTAHVEKYYDAD